MFLEDIITVTGCLTCKIYREVGLNVECDTSWRILLLRRAYQ